MKHLISPFKYLNLVNERGNRVMFRDAAAILILAALLASPFLLVPGTNFTGASGFVDKLGAFSSVLAGFYVAALVAIATFSSTIGDLDASIDYGKIYVGSVKGEELTRREYVCAIFGFLSFCALWISLLSFTINILSPVARSLARDVSVFMLYDTSGFIKALRALLILLYTITVSTLLITTLHGLHYLTDKIYVKKPQILPKKHISESDSR